MSLCLVKRFVCRFKLMARIPIWQTCRYRAFVLATGELLLAGHLHPHIVNRSADRTSHSRASGDAGGESSWACSPCYATPLNTGHAGLQSSRPPVQTASVIKRGVLVWEAPWNVRGRQAHGGELTLPRRRRERNQAYCSSSMHL